jgi:hypothetical protein
MRPITQKEKITLNTFPTTSPISTANKQIWDSQSFLVFGETDPNFLPKTFFFPQKRVAKFRPVFFVFQGEHVATDLSIGSLYVEWSCTKLWPVKWKYICVQRLATTKLRKKTTVLVNNVAACKQQAHS